MPRIICLMGITCSGKDTLAERIQQLYPDHVGLIQIGKELRKRHPPEYFKGLGAMAHTETEVWSIFEEQKKLSEDKKLIVLVGVPRLCSQVIELMNRVHVSDIRFYLLDVSGPVLSSRINKRFNNQNDGWLTLAKERVLNDKMQLFDVICQMMKQGLDFERIIETEGRLDHVARSLYAREAV